MNTVIIIPRENKKAREVMKKLHETKSALREFIANGGSAKDFKTKKTGLA